jgi:hypothetical protein
MSRTRRSIELTAEERRELEVYTKTGSRNVKLFKRAAIILAPDTSGGREPETETDIAHRIGVRCLTVRMAKKDFGEAVGLTAFLQRETPPVPAKATGEPEARIIAPACGKPPEGYRTWTLRLLADTCVELPYVDSLSHLTVSRLLKNTA